MALYRVYFRNQHKFIVGRDDFIADDDARALAIARALCDACSDVATGFELWHGIRQVEMSSSPRSPDLKVDEIVAQVQNTVIERELVLRDGNWVVSESRQLLEETQRLLDGAPKHEP